MLSSSRTSNGRLEIMTPEQKKCLDGIDAEAFYLQSTHKGDSDLSNHISAIYDYVNKLRKSV